MTKDKFLKTLDIYRKFEEYLDKLDELGLRIWEHEEVDHLITEYVNMLKELCYDDNDDIPYFIWDQNYGTKADDYYITLEDGTEIKNHTPEELWDYLSDIHAELKSEEGEV